MSLSNRIAAVVPERSNRGCVTCRWVEELSPQDRAAWDQWIADEGSLTQLWQLATEEGLVISITGFRAHVRGHHKAAGE